MTFSLQRLRPRQLLASWFAYWIGLVLVMLGPALVASWRMSQQPHGHGSVNAGMQNGIISATIADAGQTTWAGSASLLTITLLTAGPPLVLWIVWLIGGSRTNNAEKTVAGQNTARELYASDSRAGIVDPSTSKRRTREES
ncbi:MAG: hypothetical protein M3Z54_13265 [Gemmatimonadota bacterium]|nr:hypothetical protein [Gemmatimonadota bacterium]